MKDRIWLPSAHAEMVIDDRQAAQDVDAEAFHGNIYYPKARAMNAHFQNIL